MRYFFVILLTLLGGCAATPNPAAITTPVHFGMIDAPQVKIYPVSVDGQSIPEQPLKAACATIQKCLCGNLVIEKTLRLPHATYERMPKQIANDDDTIEIRTKVITPAPNHIALFFFPVAQGVGRGVSSSFPDGWHQVILNAKHVDQMSFSIFFSRSEAWQLVITHELGHQLGVPANKSHKWHGPHCTDPQCVMYPVVDGRAILDAIVSLGPPLDFGPQCRRELFYAKQTYPERRAAFLRIRKQAHAGNIKAMVPLANLYNNGKGNGCDYERAVKWLKRAAAASDSQAMWKLADCYIDGRGTSKNFAMASKWYHKAAADGSAEGEIGIGMMYAKGLGVAKNKKQAIRWYRKAAKQGNKDAQRLLRSLSQGRSKM